jgi:hypothetical protein
VRAGSFPTYRSASRELIQDQTWDLGTVQLQRGGQLRLEVPQPFAPKSGISLSIFEPGGRYVSSVDQRKQPYRSRPLAPGDYLLRISGAGVIPQSIPFVIRAGAETTQRATIRRGSPVVLEFGLPQEGAAAAWRLDFTLEGPDGFRFDYPITAYQESRFPPRKLGLANGRYTVRARTGQGQTGRLTFDVVESSIPLTLRIDLR